MLTPLPALLEAEVKAAEALCAVLEREHLALTERSFDASGFDRLLSDKSACLTRLQQLSSQRTQYLSERGFDSVAGKEVNDTMAVTMTATMTAAIARLDNTQRTLASALWRKLSELGQQAQNQNERNGAIVNARRQFTEQALAALHGYSVAEQLYDQDARVSGRHSATVATNRPLASA